jgi:hypothetical protein
MNTKAKAFMTVCAALVAAAAGTVPAGADHLRGGPLIQNGKCWKDSGGWRDSRFGVWRDCAERTANAAECADQLKWTQNHVGYNYYDVCGGKYVSTARAVAGKQAHTATTVAGREARTGVTVAGKDLRLANAAGSKMAKLPSAGYASAELFKQIKRRSEFVKQ